MTESRGLRESFHQRAFDWLYARSLVYNACWEDPAVDRRALRLSPSDVMLVIASAGCNVLDYALTGVCRIHAVDANPRQIALLELKLAGIRRLDYEDFFALFGRGRHPRARKLYCATLRPELSPFARAFWDDAIRWFEPGMRPGFYFYGLAGWVARAFRAWFAARPRLRRAVHDLLSAASLDEQREIYDRRVAPLLWGRVLCWVLERQVTMNLVGVPGAQSVEVRSQHPGGVPGFVRDAVSYVFRCLPARSNYFWALYVRGHYTPDCCPEYLKPQGFAQLRAGAVQSVLPHTATVTQFLRASSERISRFVLLDHMDWMSTRNPAALLEEWQAILERATPGARIIFRSAHAEPAYLRLVRVLHEGHRQPLREAFQFHPELAQALSLEDRVHTYGGFHIADAPA